MSNIYDNEEFFEEYAKMARSQKGLDGAGEWHQLKAVSYTHLDVYKRQHWHCQKIF